MKKSELVESFFEQKKLDKEYIKSNLSALTRMEQIVLKILHRAKHAVTTKEVRNEILQNTIDVFLNNGMFEFKQSIPFLEESVQRMSKKKGKTVFSGDEMSDLIPPRIFSPFISSTKEQDLDKVKSINSLIELGVSGLFTSPLISSSATKSKQQLKEINWSNGDEIYLSERITQLSEKSRVTIMCSILEVIYKTVSSSALGSQPSASDFLAKMDKLFTSQGLMIPSFNTIKKTLGGLQSMAFVLRREITDAKGKELWYVAPEADVYLKEISF